MQVIDPTQRTEQARWVRLGRDRWVTIRSIESGDTDGLFDFYARLSPGARITRFLGASSGISAGGARRFASAGHRHTEGFVAILHEPGPEDGAIVGHLCMEPTGPQAEEVAVAVGDGFRGRGIGTALVAAAVASARRRGVSRLTAAMFPSNQSMRRLLLDAGLAIASDRIESGVEEMQLDVAA